MPRPINIVLKGDYTDRDVKRAIKDLQSLQAQGGKTASEMSVLNKQVSGFSSSLKKSFAGLGAGLAAGFGLSAINNQIGQAIGAASDLAESQSKVKAVFGDSAASVDLWANSATTALLMSKQAALENASTFGNLFQAFGVGRDQAVTMSKSLVSLAADLASFNNTSVEDAILALRSGVSGEMEPLKRYGVALLDTRVKAEALAMGLYNGKGQLDVAARAQASYSLILKDTALAQGDVERTASGYANTIRSVQAAVENAQASIGQGFVSAIQASSEAVGGPKGLTAQIEGFGRGLGGAVEQAGDLAAKLKLLGDASLSAPDEYDESGWRKFVMTIPLLGPSLAGLSLLHENLARSEGEAAIAAQALAQDQADTAMQHRFVSDAVRGTTTALDAETDSVTKLKDELAKLNRGLDHMSARSSVEAAIDAFAGADTQGTRKWKDKHGKTHTSTFTKQFQTDWNSERDTFNLGTAAGRKGLDLASALISATQAEAATEYDPKTGRGSRKAARETFAYGRRNLVDQLAGIGVPRSEARAFARANLATPASYQRVTNNNTYIQQMTVNTKNAQEAGIVVATTGRMTANSTRPKTTPRGASPAFDSTVPDGDRTGPTATDRGLSPAS